MRICDMPQFINRTKLLTCGAEDTVYEVVVLMANKRCGAIVVTDDGTPEGKLAGIFSERDLLARVVAHGKDIESVKVKDFMTSSIETASPKDSVVLSMGRMSHGRFRHMPILDDEGKLLGMISQGDFMAYALREKLKEQA